MGFLKETALKMAIELVGKSITAANVAKFKYWVEMQAKTAAESTPTEVDDTILEVLGQVWTPELERAAIGFVLRQAAEFAKTTETPLDDKVIYLFAKTQGVTL